MFNQNTNNTYMNISQLIESFNLNTINNTRWGITTAVKLSDDNVIHLGVQNDWSKAKFDLLLELEKLEVPNTYSHTKTPAGYHKWQFNILDEDKEYTVVYMMDSSD